jgi:type IV secretory pathway TraG/TraD family ATPase VirD4
MPSRVAARRRDRFWWANRTFSLQSQDEGFSRISGTTGTGKSHLTKLFLIQALEEVESNPHAKLLLYDPKREFFAWLESLGLKSPVNYFFPSDRRSVALDFAKDYSDDKDAETLAYAFYPDRPRGSESPFWGESLRTIFASVYTALRRQFNERADLRLVCLVLEKEELTQQVLNCDPYQVQATELVSKNGGGSVSETADNIRKTIQSRIGKMKVLAAHLDQAGLTNGLFSLREFIQRPGEGVLVLSKDEDYGSWQEMMNGVLLLRFSQLLDKEQQDPRRKIFVVIDEFPSLCGNERCPGIKDMFLRLRSRGAVPLITDQGLTTLKPIYGEDTTAIVGQCTNVVYLRQGDSDSAEYAASDLGHERGYETKRNYNFGGEYGSISKNQVWFDRPIFSPTDIRELSLASPARGIEGYAKSALGEDKRPWQFTVSPDIVDRIPSQHKDIAEYLERDAESQRLRQLTAREKQALSDGGGGKWARFLKS